MHVYMYMYENILVSWSRSQTTKFSNYKIFIQYDSALYTSYMSLRDDFFVEPDESVNGPFSDLQ